MSLCCVYDDAWEKSAALVHILQCDWCGVCSWVDQSLEPPPVPADMEDCTCNRDRQHRGGQTQRDDICDGMDDVQVDAASW